MSDRCPEAQEPGEDHVSQGGCCNGQQHSAGLSSCWSANLGRLRSDTTALHYFLNHSSRESSHDVEMLAEPGRVRGVERRGKIRGDISGHNMSV